MFTRCPLPVLERIRGVVLYDGASLLDGSPIVAIATGLDRPSTNPKTGTMIQTYILAREQTPLEALRSGSDRSVCGDCPFSSLANGGIATCYVNVAQGPQSVYRAYLRGAYPQLATSHLPL